MHLVELTQAHPEFSEMDMKKTMNPLKIVNQVEQEVETSLVADKDGHGKTDTPQKSHTDDVLPTHAYG